MEEKFEVGKILENVKVVLNMKCGNIRDFIFYSKINRFGNEFQ